VLDGGVSEGEARQVTIKNQKDGSHPGRTHVLAWH
jgi:hypothetical protein